MAFFLGAFCVLLSFSCFSVYVRLFFSFLFPFFASSFSCHFFLPSFVFSFHHFTLLLDECEVLVLPLSLEFLSSGNQAQRARRIIPESAPQGRGSALALVSSHLFVRLSLPHLNFPLSFVCKVTNLMHPGIDLFSCRLLMTYHAITLLIAGYQADKAHTLKQYRGRVQCRF